MVIDGIFVQQEESKDDGETGAGSQVIVLISKEQTITE
jgi:hypothetical protein